MTDAKGDLFSVCFTSCLRELRTHCGHLKKRRRKNSPWGLLLIPWLIWGGRAGTASEFDWPAEVRTLSVVGAFSPRDKNRLLAPHAWLTQIHHNNFGPPRLPCCSVCVRVCVCDMAWETREWWAQSDTWPLRQLRINGHNRWAPLERMCLGNKDFHPPLCIHLSASSWISTPVSWAQRTLVSWDRQYKEFWLVRLQGKCVFAKTAWKKVHSSSLSGSQTEMFLASPTLEAGGHCCTLTMYSKWQKKTNTGSECEPSCR